MDVLLTRTARRALEAAALGGGRTASGLLLGHKRGGRFVIESAVPSGRGSFPGREAYVRLASILGDEVVGFFSSPPAPGLRKKTPPPFSVGKLFVSVKAGRAGRLSCRAFFIDYAERFVWKPLRFVPFVVRRHA
ncbi:MAG: hypothetical protein A2Y86_02735 [Candidatus Aminicenantes bacterium RBG_13_62_12]|nr:MAG: hypothetical protein A2Y86_02735 [Candidatus Aminicenantes bacterium RBG_13_62_12]